MLALVALARVTSAMCDVQCAICVWDTQIVETQSI